MAKLEVVIVEDGSGYYLSDGENETEHSVDWGMPLEFNGTSYLADVDDSGDVVTLAKVIEMDEDDFDVVSESDDDDDDEGEPVAVPA